MGLYKPTVTRPLPEGANIIERNGQRFARLPADETGKRREVKLSKSGRAYLDKGGNWWGSFRHPVTDELTKLSLGTADKTAAATLLDDARRRAALEKAGLVNKHEKHHKRPIAEHLEDWRAALTASGCTGEYAKKTAYRVQVVFAGCEFKAWGDIEPARVQSFIAELRDKSGRKVDGERIDGQPVSLQTRNYYLAACKSFCYWMVKNRRAADSPLSHLEGWNAATDRRHERRALGADELRALLAATETAPDRFGMIGTARAMLYRLAVSTGLRANELRTLTWRNIDLDAEPATVTVSAAYAKNRRADTLPLRADVAQSLTAWRSQCGKPDPDAVLFAGMPRPECIVQFFRADLLAARAAWLATAPTDKARAEWERSDFLAYQDGAGRFADFHALRHSFISALAAGGVHPKTAQRLARHSSITLTMNRYTHQIQGAESEALKALPDLGGPTPEAMPVRKLGTNDAPAVTDSCCITVARRTASGAYLSASQSIEGPKLAIRENSGKQGENTGFAERKDTIAGEVKKSPQGKSNPCLQDENLMFF